MARGLLLRLCRPVSHSVHRYANIQKPFNSTGVFLPPPPSPAQFSSSAAKLDRAEYKKHAKAIIPKKKPEPGPEDLKRLKKLAQTLGNPREDPDASLDPDTFNISKNKKQAKEAVPKNKPEPGPEDQKRLKKLAQILGNPREDPDASLDSDTFLLKVLKKELKKADQSVQKYKVEIKGSFDPFELVPAEGTGDLTLRRQMGEEEIVIKCYLELEEPDDEEYLAEDNEDIINTIQHLKMNIQIKKASLGDETRFQLLCHYMSQSLKIEEIIYLEKSAYVENDFPYIGPLFSDLSDTMQQSFYNIIKERGIDASLADLALDHLSAKYQDEYLRWVKNLRRFLKRKEVQD